MKLAKLVSASDKLRKINARFVKIVGYKNGWDKAGHATAICRTYTPREYKGGRVVPATDYKRYTSSIKFLDKQLNVKVSCSCPDYTFAGWEYANHLAGASDLIYGNGEPPTIKNPQNKIGLCKHLLALRAFIQNKHGV